MMDPRVKPAGDGTTHTRHGRACHRKSGLPDLRHSIMRNSGRPELRRHLRPACCEKDVDARDKRGHDESTLETAKYNEASSGAVVLAFLADPLDRHYLLVLGG